MFEAIMKYLSNSLFIGIYYIAMRTCSTETIHLLSLIIGGGGGVSS